MPRRKTRKPAKPARAYHHGDLRAALIQAALAMLEQDGAAGLSLRAVAKAVGVSEAAPYHHFADKEALERALAAEGFGRLTERLTGALLAAGQNSTLTGTLAGQIVMEGFLDIRLKPWVRRLITRAVAIIPAILVIGIAGEGKVTSLIILSQVVLCFQLPFAVIPLVQFTSNRAKMGEFANSRALSLVAWTVAVVILLLNFEYLWLIFRPNL